MASTEKQLDLRQITIDPTLQPRVDGIDPDYVRALEDALDTVPPILVVKQEGRDVLVDGFQRVAAFQNRGDQDRAGPGPAHARGRRS